MPKVMAHDTGDSNHTCWACDFPEQKHKTNQQ